MLCAEGKYAHPMETVRPLEKGVIRTILQPPREEQRHSAAKAHDFWCIVLHPRSSPKDVGDEWKQSAHVRHESTGQDDETRSELPQMDINGVAFFSR